MGSSPSSVPVPASHQDAERLPKRLNQLEQLRTCLQSALGHELPNQLVAVQGLVKLLELEERDRLTAEGRDYLVRVAAAARRTHELVLVLADVCRAAREPPREPAAVLLGDVTNEVVAEIKRLFPGAAIQYHVTNPSPILPVPRGSLRRVLLELLKNVARTAEERPLRLTLEVKPSGTGLELIVRDDGDGIKPEQLRQLFEPFACASAGGMGLGLFLVRQLVESWGGTVRVESEAGRGTTVAVALPAEEPSSVG